MKIHQVKTRLVNSYVIEYPDRLFVMDVAAKCERYVLGFVEHELGRDIAEIELVVCSHDDPDHIGGLAALAARCAAAVAIPYASGALGKKLANDPLGGLMRLVTGFREALRPRAWNMYLNPGRDRSARRRPTAVAMPGEVTAAPGPVVRLKDRATLPGFDDWQVIHTPGHTWDSCCFYHAGSRSLLSGDVLLGSGKRGLLVTPSVYANPGQMRKSLRRLKVMDICAVYPGHGSVITGPDILAAVETI